MNAVEPAEHLLDQQFGLAVGVGGQQAGGFVDGDGFRLAVDGGGGGKDQLSGPWASMASKRREGGGGVVPEESFGGYHGFAGFDEGRKMEYAVERGARCRWPQ